MFNTSMAVSALTWARKSPWPRRAGKEETEPIDEMLYTKVLKQTSGPPWGLFMTPPCVGLLARKMVGRLSSTGFA